MDARTPLQDIGNTENALGFLKKRKRRLNNGDIKEYTTPRRPRKSVDISFANDTDKDKFDVKWRKAKEELNVKSTEELLNKMLDIVLGQKSKSSVNSSHHRSNENFICSKDKLFELVNNTSCEIYSYTRDGHVAIACLRNKQTNHYFQWTSSCILADNYDINYKMYHGFLCSGMLNIQYEKLCLHANVGITTPYFRKKIAVVYSAAVARVCERSLSSAMDVERASGEGLQIATDARHACRKNSYHTDMVALGYKTHRVVHYEHITKAEEPCSQKHEAKGVEKMYESFDQNDIQVSVHAHDRNSAVSVIVGRQEGVKDALDTWHGEKEVKKTVAKITSGARKWSGIKWHPELQDKAAAVKTHTYWAMLNCEGDPAKLRGALDNITEHYQNRHANCHQNARCKQPGYVPSRLLLTEATAVNMLRECLHGLYMYKHPEKYTECMNTHYVESFNNLVLVYIDKRVHYHDLMYMIRIQLAILDWNENVDRPATSVRRHNTPGQANNPATYRVLKPKTFQFVESIWEEFLNELGGVNLDVPEHVLDENITDDESDDDNDDDEDDD